jgi:hypothetical protein
MPKKNDIRLRHPSVPPAQILGGRIERHQQHCRGNAAQENLGRRRKAKGGFHGEEN